MLVTVTNAPPPRLPIVPGMRAAVTAICLMIEFSLSATALAAEPAFSPAEVLGGVPSTPAQCDGAGRIWVEIGGQGDCLRFYGAAPERARADPVIFLEGDVVQQSSYDRDSAVWDISSIVWEVSSFYSELSPAVMQAEAEQYAGATARPFINLARPGVYGSSGNHLQRRREREVALVDRALDRLKERFGWDRIDLAGVSGGGHLVAALMARRSDVGCAIIASGNVAVRKRLRERGLEVDVTGYADFIDPMDLVAEVARHPPRKVIMLTDPQDAVVTASTQRAYLEALRAAGVDVEQRLIPARDPRHHRLRIPAIVAALACQSDR
jgi:dienelactone hydrolase